MKKILLIIVCLFMLSGCTDYVEIDDLAILTGIIIDYKDDMYEVTAELVINEKESEVKVYTTTSKSIEESLALISKLCNKELFISDLKALIITDNVLESNINYYDTFLRSAKLKMNFNVYLIDSSLSKEILSLYKDNNGSSLYLNDVITFNEKVFSSSYSLEFIDLVHTLLEYGITPVYPSIIVKDENGEKTLYLDKLITYNSSNEKQELNEIESIMYNIIRNNSKNTILDIDCGNDNFTLEFKDIKTGLEFTNNTLNVNIDISSKIKNYHCKYDLNDPSSYKKLADISKEYFNKEINNLINLSKENDNDFLGFGNYIYKHNKDYFNFKKDNWYKEYKDLKVNVKSNITIVSSGEIRTSVGDKNAKNK